MYFYIKTMLNITSHVIVVTKNRHCYSPVISLGRYFSRIGRRRCRRNLMTSSKSNDTVFVIALQRAALVPRISAMWSRRSSYANRSGRISTRRNSAASERTRKRSVSWYRSYKNSCPNPRLTRVQFRRYLGSYPSRPSLLVINNHFPHKCINGSSRKANLSCTHTYVHAHKGNLRSRNKTFMTILSSLCSFHTSQLFYSLLKVDKCRLLFAQWHCAKSINNRKKYTDEINGS